MLNGGLCEITDVQFASGKQHPLIVTFQNGELVPKAVDNLQFGFYRDKKTGERIVAVASESRVYRGCPTPASSKLCRTLLAIRNKLTNKVRLIEVENVNLLPVVKSDTQVVQETESTENTEAYSKLYRAFGSKKVKRIVEHQEATKLEVEHMEQQLSQALSAAEQAKNETNSQDPEKSPAHPSPSITDEEVVPCDRTATTPDKIYNLNDFVTEEELNSFSEEAERISSGQIPMDSYSKFFHSCLKEIPPATHVQGIKILLYAECLIRFINLTYKDLRIKTVTVCRQSESVNSRILSNFTVSSDSGRTRPLHIRDKAICHVIVLGLLANKLKLNIEPLLASIKIGGTRLQQLCRALGAVASSTNKNVVVLKAPLPTLTATPKRGRAGRGGRQR